ncbi:hypothetical protein [Paenibacillus marinisediminis]
MSREQINLMNFFEGYVRNYRSLNLHDANKSMFTIREIDYFARLGEYLGYYSFFEDSKPDLLKGRSRPMDLAWWKWDARENKEEYLYLVLHLERENLFHKAYDTLDKLFSASDEYYKPRYVIGIQNIECAEKIEDLNKTIIRRNELQKSEVLMIYRYYEEAKKYDQVVVYYYDSDNRLVETRKAISKRDSIGYWMMYFEEDED